jgi:hypothetical protein
MELPITKPSQVSYADELEYSELMEKMSDKEYDGFIRITHGSEEGYILFEEGKPVAVSYDKYFKNDALNKIKKAMEKSDSLIEVFDLKSSQIGYLLDLNKTYKLDSPKDEKTSPNKAIDKNSQSDIYGREDLFNPQAASYRQPISKMGAEKTVEQDIYSEKIPEKPPQKVTEVVEEVPLTDIKKEVKENVPEIKKESVETSSTQESVFVEPSEPVEEVHKKQIKNEEYVNSPKNEPKTVNEDIKSQTPDILPEPVKEIIEESSEESSPKSTEESIIDEEELQIPVDREELMQKYGLKDIQEEEIDNILETYKGGTLSSIEMEKIELTLMNKIKKSVMGMPKIKGTEVMVFLEYTNVLGGKIRVITEYETKGLFSRLMGEAKAVENLRYQILDIVEMEIRKNFREYPEIVENFEINIEIVK